jgi:hypothetical protein
MALLKKELFICDNCGWRKRLPSAARHWCENCNHGAPVEMRPSRVKKPVMHVPTKEAPARANHDSLFSR